MQRNICHQFVDKLTGNPVVGAEIVLEDVQGLSGPYALTEIGGGRGFYFCDGVAKGVYRVLRDGVLLPGVELEVAPGRFEQGAHEGLVDVALRTMIYARDFGPPCAATAQAAIDWAKDPACPFTSRPTVMLSPEAWAMESQVLLRQGVDLDCAGATLGYTTATPTAALLRMEKATALRRGFFYAANLGAARPYFVEVLAGANEPVAFEGIAFAANNAMHGVDFVNGGQESRLLNCEFAGILTAINLHGRARNLYHIEGCSGIENVYVGRLNGDSFGTHTGPVVGDTSGTHTGPVVGDTTGHHTGSVTGDCSGSHTGNLNGATLQPYKSTALKFLAANTGGIDVAATGEFAWMYHGVKDGLSGGSACTLYAKLPYGSSSRNLTQPVVLRLTNVNPSFRGAPDQARYIPVVVTIQEDSGALRGHKIAYAGFAPGGAGGVSTDIALYKADGTAATFGDLATVSTDALIVQFSDTTLGHPTSIDP